MGLSNRALALRSTNSGTKSLIGQPPSTAGRSQLTHSEPPAWLTLREAGLLDCERRGTWVYYWVVPAAMAQLSAVLTLDLNLERTPL